MARTRPGGRGAVRRRPARPRLRVVLGLLLAPLLVACGAGPAADIDGPDRQGYHGSVVRPPFRLHSVPLAATSGSTVDLARDRHDVTLVFFGYTNCPDICQIVMGTIASAYARLSTEDRQRVGVVFVTTDPARDDAGRLRSYLNRFNPSFVGATGPLADIEKLGRQLAVFLEKGQRLPSGGYEVNHSTQVFAVSHGRAPLMWSGEVSPADLAADVERLLAAGGSLDEADAGPAAGAAARPDRGAA